MKAIGDIESVNLSTGERRQRVTGDGESFLRSWPFDPRFGPKQPTEIEVLAQAKLVTAEILRIGEPKMLRCKFRLNSVKKSETNRDLRFDASMQKDGDNKDWSKWTPSGSLTINVTNEAAFPQIDAMKEGEHFYIDINKVE